MTITNFVDQLGANLQESLEMTEVLGHDCKEFYDAIQNGGSQSQRRAYVRSVFAFVEGVTYRMKETARQYGTGLSKLSAEELFALNDLSIEVNADGEITSKPSYPKFLNNFKFVFRMYSKVFGSTYNLDCGNSGWENLKKANKVRDRLVHPKNVADLDVLNAEIAASKKAFDWFLLNHGLLNLYAQKAVQSNSKPAPNVVADLEQRISTLEEIMINKGFKVRNTPLKKSSENK